MDEVRKILQAILAGQAALKQELLSQIRKVDQKVDNLDEKMDGVEKRLTKRIDKIGLQLAYLEDDTPTREEFDKLEGRVNKIEHKTTSV